MSNIQEYEIQKLGWARNAPRFYKQGKRLRLAGFVPGKRFNAVVVQEKGMVVLRLDTAGTNTVSKKDDDTPVVDVNRNDVFQIFQGMDQVRVIVREGEIFIMALATEVRRKERLERLATALAAGEPISVGSVSHGVGVLSHALHQGMASAGVRSSLAFANDIESDYLRQAENANDVWSDKTVPIIAPIQELAFDDWAVRSLPPVHLLEGGLPCTAASVAGRAKKGLEKPEDDPNVGHLMVSFLALISRLNPAVVLFENVVAYANTASMAMFRTQMRDFAYDVHERIVEAREFGALENRKRLIAVAVTRGLEFDFDSIVADMVAESERSCVADVLDPIPDDAPVWSPMQYLKDKEVRDAAKGSCFSRQEVHPGDRSVPTITRGYMKRRSTDPMLVNSSNPDLLRLFTPNEHARIKQNPAHLFAGMSATRAHEALGQSVCYKGIVAVGKLIGFACRSALCALAPSAPKFKLAA